MVTDPTTIGIRVNAPVSAEIDFVVPYDLHYLRGHFANAPVVPGVVQIKWAIGFARELLRIAGEFGGMEAVKFQQVMPPGSRATLKLDYSAASGKLRFTFEHEHTRYSSGRILLR